MVRHAKGVSSFSNGLLRGLPKCDGFLTHEIFIACDMPEIADIDAGGGRSICAHDGRCHREYETIMRAVVAD